MAETLRFGIVGCGVIGPAHAEAIESLAEAELVAVADCNPAAADKLAETYGARAYSDLQQMLNDIELDVVDVCTPSGLHAEQACQVMNSGRHVIVEKPMALSLAAIDEMMRVQEEMGVKLAVVSQYRFEPASRRVQELMEKEAFGRLVLGCAQIPWWRSQTYYDSGGWRGTREMDGGGTLMNQSIHWIDLLQWFMGRVRSVCAYADTLAHRMETEDVAVASLRFANGALGTVAATTAAYPGLASRVEVFGNRGSAVIENGRLAYLHLARDDPKEVGAYGLQEQPEHRGGRSGHPPGATPTTNTLAMQIADMIRAIREDSTPLVDGRAARHPVEIILAIYESARRSEEVVIP
jgi:predicted dehydrogenase